VDFTSLNNSGLDITRGQVFELFQPFVAQSFEASDAPWRAELRRRESRIRRKYLKRIVLGWLPSTQRNERTVIDEYAKAWQPSEYEKYNLERPLARVSPWEWGDRKLFASDVGATRFRQLILIRVIEQLRPRSVLEVGCGNGINLILLACRFPDIEFTGVELTEQGHQAALEFQKQAELPRPMQDYAPLELADTSAFRRIRFIQGSAAELPFKDNSFDLVATILALEQMERIRDRALREITRVSARHLFNIEPFRDLNDEGGPKRNVIQRNYFRGRIDDLNRYGFSPTLALQDFPQEAFLKAGAVLSKKEGA
jgi:SAM-dependent methyltransferase